MADELEKGGVTCFQEVAQQAKPEYTRLLH